MTAIDLEPADGLDEVEITRVTAATLVLGRELGEAEGEMLEVHQCLLAVVALDACGAAGEGGKDIIAVHGSNLVGVAIPGLEAVAADHLVGTDHAAQADGGQVCVLAF